MKGFFTPPSGRSIIWGLLIAGAVVWAYNNTEFAAKWLGPKAKA